MSRKIFDKLVDQVRAQYFPDGSIELLHAVEVKNEELGNFFLKYANDGTRKITVETDTKIAVIARLTQQLFVKVSVPIDTYNIGILNNVTEKIFKEVRKNAIKPVK